MKIDKIIDKNERKTAIEWFESGIEQKIAGNYQKAIKCFEKVVAIDPKNKDAWIKMGESYEQLGNYQKTIECYEKADELS
ncbi:MAG: tetratricopeptide repeat protein [Candidatus Helarchaeota archaeon]